MRNIDETELARLEALALDSQKRYVPRFVYEACNAVPALVAEVRRLREKVAAWEWFGECQETYRKCFLNVTYRHNILPCLYPEDVRKDAMQEMVDILVEAKEAVHADRE